MLVLIQGTGTTRIGETETSVGESDLSFVPSGVYHNFINDGSGPLKRYTTYSPPEHEAGVQHKTVAADAAEH